MAKVVIIGAGGVGTVRAHKVAKVPQVFTDIMLASRTKSKCDAIAKAVGAERLRRLRWMPTMFDNCSDYLKALSRKWSST